MGVTVVGGKQICAEKSSTVSKLNQINACMISFTYDIRA